MRHTTTAPALVAARGLPPDADLSPVASPGRVPGHYLRADEDQPWLMGLRDRLRSKLVRTVVGLSAFPRKSSIGESSRGDGTTSCRALLACTPIPVSVSHR